MSKRLGYFGALIFFSLNLFFVSCGHSCGVTETCNPTSNTAGTSGDSFSETSGVFDGNVVQSDSTDTGTPVSSDECAECSVQLGESTTFLLNLLCTSLDDCSSGVSTTLCATNLDTDTNLLNAFGVEATAYASFSDVQEAINTNSLSISSTEITACKTAIEALTCTQIETTGAFSNTSSSDYSDVYKMLPEEC